MKVVVLGAGLMGKEVARDLIKNDKVESVFLGDIDVKVAQDFVDTLDSNKVEVVELHAERDDSLMDVMSKGDVVVNALFYSFNERVARAAIEAGVHSVDLGGHIGGVTEKILDLHEEAKAKGVTIIGLRCCARYD